MFQVVQMLLSLPNVNVNLADEHGQTALYWAAVNGHEGVAKLLIER